MTRLTGTRRQREPQIASWRPRFLAGAIDAAALSIGLGLGAAASFGLAKLGVTIRWRRLPDWIGRRVHPPAADGDAPSRRSRSPRWAGLTVWAISVVGAVLGRNYRSPGKRKLGLRRVEVRTGGPVSVRAALVQCAAAAVWGRLLRLAFGPLEKPSSRRLREAQAEIRAIQRRHHGDSEERNREIMRVYEERGINPLASCGWAAVRAAVGSLPAFFTPRHQSIPELLAGVVVIEE